ncbi:MAG: hypothetical protein B7Z49_01525 [Hydrogenophilales bacterium 12-63-5]|nr:MAG: hypothetical protein B7Z49_01525 [Hydrogenophilales bacterium 12-63-5]
MWKKGFQLICQGKDLCVVIRAASRVVVENQCLLALTPESKEFIAQNEFCISRLRTIACAGCQAIIWIEKNDISIRDSFKRIVQPCVSPLAERCQGNRVVAKNRVITEQSGALDVLGTPLVACYQATQLIE